MVAIGCHYYGKASGNVVEKYAKEQSQVGPSIKPKPRLKHCNDGKRMTKVPDLVLWPVK